MHAPKENNDQFFHEVFHGYKVQLHDYLKAVTGSHEVAQDITQEIFITLWRKRHELSHIEHLNRYIFTIAKNESIDYFKKVAQQVKLSRELHFHKETEAGNEDVSLYINQKELVSKVQRGLSALSPQRRKVYELSRNEGLSIEEIAEKLLLSPNTVKNHLVEALRQLREFLMDKNVKPLVVICLLLH